ncbi:hypothetical protein [Clostridium sp. Cult1]|nr:hypothetical protein [Clostridium sp. Cult1]
MDDKIKDNYISIDMELGIDINNLIQMYETELNLSIKQKTEGSEEINEKR